MKLSLRNQTDLFIEQKFEAAIPIVVPPLVHPKPQKSPRFIQVCNRFKILPHYSVQYAYVFNPERIYNHSRPLSNKSRGLVSEKAAKKIRNAMTWLMFFSQWKFVYSKEKKRGFRFKLNFITLTLSSAQFHSDKYIVRHMLQPFIKWLQHNHGVINYVWKAEVQDNGNIHFHITTNKFIPQRSIAAKWNDLQLSHEYISVDEHVQFQIQSPSTQVKSVRNNGEIVSYMTKYICKGMEEIKDVRSCRSFVHVHDAIEYELGMASVSAVGIPFTKRLVDCKVWGCNYSLSRIDCTLTEASENFWNDKAEFIDKFCTQFAYEKHYNIWLNTLDRAEEIPVSIRDLFDRAWEMFMTNDDGVTKYTVD